MKPHIIIPTGLLLACLAWAQAAPAAPERGLKGVIAEDAYQFVAEKGDWGKKANWRASKTPSSAGRVDVRGGCALTVNAPTATLGIICLLGKTGGKTVLNIEEGADISTVAVTSPFGGAPDAHTLIDMKGGQLKVGNPAEFGGMLRVGGNSTVSGLGEFVISGGRLSANVIVGTDLANTQKGVFRVVGGAAKVSAAAPLEDSRFFVLGSGALEFVLDADGVSALDYRKGVVRLKKGGALRVDGKNYAGGPKTITLIEAKAIEAQDVTVVVANFPAPLKATVSFERSQAVLKISK